MSYLALEHKTLDFIRRKNLLKEEDRVLLALSGGLDSMVLLHLLHRLHYRVLVAHCHFGLRGAESDADEAFCEERCRGLQIPFTSKHFDTRAYAAEKKMSLQMAARELRYAWFQELMSSHGCQALATAHHLEDQTETVLLNLVAGKSAESLRGMQARNQQLIRPLLFAAREELLAYAEEKKIDWREDSSNESREYRRNFLRHEVIPLLKTINPSLHASVHRLSTHLGSMQAMAEGAADALLASCSEQKEEEFLLRYPPILNHPAKGYLLWKALSPYGFSGAVIEEMLESGLQPGRSFQSENYRLHCDRDCFIISRNTDAVADAVYSISLQDALCTTARGTILLRRYEKTEHPLEMNDPDSASLDAALLQYPLLVRHWQAGDHFYPLGMNQPKKLSDYFIDRKIPLPQKHRILLLQSGPDIVWVIGERIDQRYRITEKTKTVAHFKWQAHA
ncbi:MAG: tRNA lysidine(34) synthetase TilS [Bacteroidia bacterium]|nr:tRNA lysidine(34) synthetase TilS [Bacteroidia bacterium]